MESKMRLQISSSLPDTVGFVIADTTESQAARCVPRSIPANSPKIVYALTEPCKKKRALPPGRAPDVIVDRLTLIVGMALSPMVKVRHRVGAGSVHAQLMGPPDDRLV